MKHGSLFSGIGGFDLAAEWMGWQNVFHCEWNPFGQKVLKHYWPQSISYNDITKTDFTIHRGQIDIITGGFPCQPYSMAGKRKGKEDDRHLWPEMLRAIREIQPRWVVGENVRGLTNWNGGMVFDEVQADLEAIGYEITPFLLPACAVNAPHRRDRIWFIAHNMRFGFKRYEKQTGNWKDNKEQIRNDKFCEKQRWDEIRSINERNCENKRNVTNTNGDGLNECDSNNEINTSETRINAFSNINESNGNGDATDSSGNGGREDNRERESRFFNKESKGNNWQNFPTVAPICNGDDGLSDRLDNITFSKWRNESIKAGGNAIVPQVVYQIFKAIEQYEHQRPSNTTNR